MNANGHMPKTKKEKMNSKECIPCLLGQTLKFLDTVDADDELSREVLRFALGEVEAVLDGSTAPEVAGRVYSRIVEITGVADPFAKMKDESIRGALGLFERMRSVVGSADDKFAKALELSIAGNAIDLAVVHPDSVGDVIRSLSEFSENKFSIDDGLLLKDDLKDAKIVLVIGDNAGESVFDRLFMELIDGPRLIYAVRGGPTLNDVTFDDAVASGIGAPVEIISTGSAIPGVVLNKASDEFLEIFFKADVVIAKGQGNFETLFDPPRPVYHMFKVKCDSVANIVESSIGDFVIWKNNGKI